MVFNSKIHKKAGKSNENEGKLSARVNKGKID